MGLQLDFKEDDIILKEKVLSPYMYLIIKGSVALYSGYGTSEEYLYGILSKGKTFGEIGLLTHEESIYSAVAISDVKVAVFSENELGTFIKAYPDNAIGIMRSIAKMNQLFRTNLKMLEEENLDHVRYKELYDEAVKQLSGVDDEAEAKWRYNK